LRFFRASIAELAHGEKSRSQSLNHSTSLFDTPGTEALALRDIIRLVLTLATLPQNSYRSVLFLNTAMASIRYEYWREPLIWANVQTSKLSTLYICQSVHLK